MEDYSRPDNESSNMLVKEVFKTFTEAQKTVVYYLVGSILNENIDTLLTESQKDEIRELQGKYILENEGVSNE